MHLYSEKNLRQLKAIRLRFRRNLRGFWTKHRFEIYFLVITAFLDAATTSHFMLLLGVDREVNPQIWALANWLGPIAGPIAGKILQITIGLVAVVYVRRYARIILLAAASFYLYAAGHNIFFTHRPPERQGLESIPEDMVLYGPFRTDMLPRGSMAVLGADKTCPIPTHAREEHGHVLLGVGQLRPRPGGPGRRFSPPETPNDPPPADGESQ